MSSRAVSSESRRHDGGCTCRFVRYRMVSEPMFVHCCHRRGCQRESGSAFAVDGYQKASERWPAESLVRREVLFASASR